MATVSAREGKPTMAMQSGASSQVVTEGKPGRVRLPSLDAFRGLAIAAMIFVNLPGAPVWPQLEHAAWNGLTIADLVFPAFLVAVGASLAVGRTPTAARVTRRVLILVALGLVVNRASFDGPWRYPGVLQRIALCYLLAVILVRLPLKLLVSATITLLIAYSAVLRIGGMSAGRSVPGTVDMAIFGQRHMYHQARYDPEGLVGSIAATATVLIGFLAVHWLRQRRPSLRTGAWLAAAAAGLGGVGFAADLAQPINKRMWTPSFTLATAGVALLALAALYLLIEVVGWRRAGLPLAVIGANAIVVYVASELGDAALRRLSVRTQTCSHLPCANINGHDWVYQHWFASTVGGRPGSLLFSAAAIAILWLIAAVMWRAKLFIRV